MESFKQVEDYIETYQKTVKAKKRVLFLIDFDDTLYLNHRQDYSENIDLEKIILYSDLYNELIPILNKMEIKPSEYVNLIFSGRNQDQENKIMRVLDKRGYRGIIDGVILRDFLVNEDIKAYYIKYWSWKLNIINDFHLSKVFDKIIVIEDDKTIIRGCIELKFPVIQTLLYTVSNYKDEFEIESKIECVLTKRGVKTNDGI